MRLRKTITLIQRRLYLEAAIDKWKFLIKRLLNGCDFVGENNSDDLAQLIGLVDRVQFKIEKKHENVYICVLIIF